MSIRVSVASMVFLDTPPSNGFLKGLWSLKSEFMERSKDIKFAYALQIISPP